VGRPRNRWADVVQRDTLQLLGVRGWRRRAENRDEWRHALREEGPEGAVAPYMDGWMDSVENTGKVSYEHQYKSLLLSKWSLNVTLHQSLVVLRSL
jgi:hypothetical protein